MNTLTINGEKLAYYEAGQGTPVLLLHCSSSNHTMWRHLVELILPQCHVIAPDFSGYGESIQYAATKTIDTLPDLAFIDALLQRFDRGVHVIGHSYGAALALEAAMQGHEKIRSLTLIEPVSFHLLKEKSETWNEAQRLTDGIINRTKSSQFTAATRIYMQYWLGRAAWLMMKKKDKNHMIATVHKVAAECQYMLKLDNTHNDLKDMAIPTTLIRGSKTRNTINDIHKMLMSELPNSREVILRGAGHLSPMTHTNMVNDIICASLMP